MSGIAGRISGRIVSIKDEGQNFEQLNFKYGKANEKIEKTSH